MFDAMTHDTNCPLANDPKAKCTCGGAARKKPVHLPRMGGAKDDSALGAMAGAMPNQPAGLPPVNNINQQIHGNKEAMIKEVAEAAFDGAWARHQLVCKRAADGTETYAFNGKDFLQIGPLEIKSARDGNTYKITATQSFKKLEP